MTSDLETRQLIVPIQMRTVTDEDDEPVIEGYAARYNKPFEVLGGFTCFIKQTVPGAFDDADMSNVVATINHDSNQVLGRPGVNMTLSSDSIGLKFTVKPIDTSFARDLTANIKTGVINQCSFAFTVANTDEVQDWGESDQDGADYERTIRQIDRLSDALVVATPAYLDTEVQVGQRSVNMVRQMQSQENRDVTDQKHKKMLRELERQELLKTFEGGN